MTTYSDSLKLTLIGDGEQTNVWGATTNTNLGTLLEQAIVGVQSIAMTGSADRVLTNLNGASDEARNAVLIITGASSGGYSVILPAGQQKTYIVTNSLTSGSVTIKPSGGTAVTIPNGVTMTIYTNGTSTQAVNYVDVAGVATTVANLPGGAAGYIPYQSAANTTSYLVPGTPGYVLTTAGAGLAPYWNPSGTATLASNLAGGAAGQVAFQTGPNTTGFTLTGTPGQFLSSNGTSPPTWTSSIPTTINGVVAGNGSSFGLATGSQIASTLGTTAVQNATSAGTATSATTAATANALNSSNSYSTTGTMTANGYTATGAGSIGDQKFTLTYAGYSTGMSPQGVQIGASGKGIIYDGSYIALGGISGGTVLSLGASAGVLISSTDNVQKPTGGSWLSSSDSRLKDNITSYTKGLDAVKSLRTVTFTLKDNVPGREKLMIDPTKVITGIVAQEALETPLASIISQGSDGYYMVDPSELTWTLVNAVKELNAKVDAQAAEIAALKG